MNLSEKSALPNSREDQFVAYWRSMLLSRAFNQIEPPAPLVNRLSTSPYPVESPVFDLQVPREGTREWCTFGKDDFLGGRASRELMTAVFARLDAEVERKNQEIRRKNARGGKFRQQEIDPLIANPTFRVEYAPCILRRRTDNRRFIPMYGVATVDRRGGLRGFSPGEASLPPPLWFRRLFMTPHDADVPLTIGEQKSYIAWVSTWLARTGGIYEWPSMLELFDGSWRAASGLSVIEWAEREGYAIEAGFVREGSSGEIMLNMHAAYGELRSAYRASPRTFSLFSNLVTGAPGPSWEGEGSYLGFLGDSWGLTSSQRSTAKAFVCTDEGRILAVNGPPGTGKTTLLRTVMADLVVRSAVEGRSAPFIVACGATNQSVTNILEAFAGAASQTATPLEQRWIPLLSSYGSYAASGRLNLNSKSWKHQVLTLNPFADFKRWDLDPDQDDMDEAIRRLWPDAGEYPTCRVSDLIMLLSSKQFNARKTWLESYRKCISVPAQANDAAIREIQIAVRAIADDIRSYDRALDAYISSVGAGDETPEDQVIEAFSEAVNAMLTRLPIFDAQSWVERWRAGFERHRDQGLGDALASAADVSLRLLAFHLSARYWEGRFLESVTREQGLPGWTREVEAFRMLSMIMPCAVSTFDRLPGLLKRSERGHGKVPMWSEVDLLIVDEAGQAGPDKGALAFAYAKRALVVGDVRQLSPVSDEDSPFFTQEIGEENGVLDDDAKHRGLLCGESLSSSNRKISEVSESGDFSQSSLEASFGSIMRASSASSSFSSSPDDSGMWLYDHFRCEPTIIDYCNRLWYGGKLIPRTTRRVREMGVPHLPPMAHLDVQGRNIRTGSSRTNPEEAARIADWLAENHDWLIRTFGNPGDGLDDVVAIVTPFSSQDRVLSEHLSERLGRKMGGRLRKLVHGTVHRMQGAERPVVIFSTVYSGDVFNGARPPAYFFDREPRLLNVAVSRAKQAFLVVGDRRVFERAPAGSPTAHLRDHLSFHQALPFLETPEEASDRIRSGLSSVIDPLRAASDWK